MIPRFDVLTARKDKDDKSWFTRIGVAFPAKDGIGFNVVLSALPMPGADGQAWLMLRPPLEKDKPTATPAASRRDDLDDEVPF